MFKILLLVYKARSGEGPKYLKDLLLPYSAHHKGLTVQLRSSDDPTLLDTPSTDKITYGDRSFNEHQIFVHMMIKSCSKHYFKR